MVVEREKRAPQRWDGKDRYNHTSFRREENLSGIGKRRIVKYKNSILKDGGESQKDI